MTARGRDLEPLFAELERWADEHAPGSVSTHAYGEHPDQHGELALPPGAGPHPVAVVVHGGFWRAAFTKRNTRALALALTAAGWATWNVEYRRVGSGGGFPQTLDDVAAACRTLDELHPGLAQRARVAVGHSAGGQLVLWAAAEGLVPAAASLAGVCDLTTAARLGLGAGAVAEFLGAGPADTRYARADPMRRLPLGAPSLLVHGTADDRVPIEQSLAFAAAARAAGDECRLVTVDGADHFDLIDPRTPVAGGLAAALAALVS